MKSRDLFWLVVAVIVVGLWVALVLPSMPVLF